MGQICSHSQNQDPGPDPGQVQAKARILTRLGKDQLLAFDLPVRQMEGRTTLTLPQTGLSSYENSALILQGLAPPQSRDMSKPESTSVFLGSKMSGPVSKVHSFGKRQFSVKRNPNITTEHRGWLHKQDGSGMRLWRRKWFVLSDNCLFYYKDSREQALLGSIPLLSHEVRLVEPQDQISRKFSFKACPSVMRPLPDKQSTKIGPFKHGRSLIGPFERSSSLIGRQVQHPGMRTYFFSAETQDDVNAWITAMTRASGVQDQNHEKTGDQDRARDHDLTTLDQSEVQNNVRKVHNGVDCGTNTRTDGPCLAPLDSSRSSEQALVHEVQLEPLLSVRSLDMVNKATTCPSLDPAPSESRLNGLDPSPSPILEPNGIAAGTYQNTSASDSPPGSVYRQATPTGRQVTPTGSVYRQTTPRRATPPNSNTRDLVQNWVKVPKEERRRSTSRNSLHRITPPSQFSPIEPQQQQTQSAPAGHSGEYRYAQDRLSHFGLYDPATAPPPFWRLVEWQQRHQYRHGNPTAPLYSPAALHPFGPRPLAAADCQRAPTPRCIEVPPSADEIPPCLPSAPIPRRPHTPAERRTVRPTDESAGVGRAFTMSPRRSQSQYFKASTFDHRSQPVSGHMTHTLSAPSLYGKTPEELTLLLIQLRRHQSKMAALRRDIDFLSANPAPRVSHTPGVSPTSCSAQVDESYLKLKKDLEKLDVKIRSLQPLISAVHSLLLHCTAGPPTAPGPPKQTEGATSKRPVRAAESDIDVKLSRLCEQEKSLRELESKISALTEDKEQLEGVLALCHQQIELSSDSVALQKIFLHQKVLQEDLVQLRAQLSRALTDFSHSWGQYLFLETSVEQLRLALKTQLDLSQTNSQDVKRELWRIEDVLSGLSSSRSRYTSTVQALNLTQERTLVPSVQEFEVSATALQSPSEAPPPPRPPLPCGFDGEEDSAPVVPPLPRDAAVIRHTSVRGLKRQADERRRSQEGGGVWKFQTYLRSFLSEPELPLTSTCSHLDPPLTDDTPQTRPCSFGSSPSRLKQSSMSAFVSLRGASGSHVESSASSPAKDWNEGQSDQSSATTSSQAPPPVPPKRSSSRERHRQILNSRFCSETQKN